MLEFCVGSAVGIIAVALSGKPFKVQGLFGIALAACAAYGLGWVIVRILGH